MKAPSVPLLLVAAATVGFLHSILPDHWVPLAVVARTRRWSIAHTARVSFLASVGHVLTSIVLAGIIAVIGLQFRSSFEQQQGHIVGVILIVTGIGFLLWALTGHGHHHHHDTHEHTHPHDHGHGHEHVHSHELHPQPAEGTVLGRFAVYSKVPGYLPDGMFDSNFFYTGYAIHGYNPAPDYPASHGCIRLPIVDAPAVFGWLQMGNAVDVYN